MRALFWTLAGLIVWHYLVYPLFLALLSRGRRVSLLKPRKWPKVSIVVAAYNEEARIARRIENCLELDYPRDRLEVIIGSDGSTDRTVKNAMAFVTRSVRVLAFSQNRGRSQVHNDCVDASSGEMIFFTDADTLFEPDFLKKMVRHYSDPKVGCVGGELRSESFKEGGLGGGQGLYWRWEYALRRWQSRLGVLTKTSGANMSMRKELYRPLPEDVDIDQAAGPLVILQGYRVVHEPEAIAYEEFPTSPTGELSTRRRLTLRALTALWRYRGLLNPFKHPWLAFHLFSYRLLRYLVPFFLIVAFISNGFLLETSWLYEVTFALQALPCLLALFGFILEKRGKRCWLFSWPFAFTWFNLGILLGGIEFLLGRRIKTYQPNE